VQAGLSAPTLLLMGDHSGETDPETHRIAGSLEELFSHLPADRREVRILNGATHFGFADDNKSPLLVGLMCRVGRRISPREQMVETRAIVSEFFGRTLELPSDPQLRPALVRDQRHRRR